MQPPRQVAAPPNGSISVGWLWVSFLNITSHSSAGRPSMETGTTMEAALTSSETSRLSSSPDFFISRMPMRAMSMSVIGLSSRPSARRVAR